jgi:hypothetical protein
MLEAMRRAQDQPQTVSLRNRVTAASRSLRSRRGRLAAPGPSDLQELVLTHHDSQHDFAARASLAQHAGTLGCRHRHWWSPMNIEISYHEPDWLSHSLTGRASTSLCPWRGLAAAAAAAAGRANCENSGARNPGAPPEPLLDLRLLREVFAPRTDGASAANNSMGCLDIE